MTAGQIVVSLCYSPKRFADLARIKGVKGGQLTHHHQPLIDEGLMKEEKDSYGMTTKGWRSLHSLLLAGQGDAQ